MHTVSGVIVFKRTGTRGFWYRLFSFDEGPCEFFSRHDSFLLFDRIEAMLLPQRDFLLLADWSLLERSPLADHPERLTIAGYLAHLITCFTEAGPRERSFVETARTLLSEPCDQSPLPIVEERWRDAMGIPIETEKDLSDIIRSHSAAAYRIRRHLTTTPLIKQGNAHD